MLSVGAGLRWSDVSPAARAKPPHDSQVDAAVGRRLIPIWVTCEPSGWKAVRYRRYPARLPKPAEVRAGRAYVARRPSHHALCMAYGHAGARCSDSGSLSERAIRPGPLRRPPERRLQTTDRLLITVDPGGHIRGAGQPAVVGEVVGKIGQLDLPREVIAGHLLDVLLVALVRPVHQADHG